MSEDSSAHDAPADIGGLLERIEGAWRQFHDALEGIPDDRLEEGGVTGEWPVKDLFGHLAYWDANAVREIPRALAGQPRADNDWQAMNETDHAARRGHSLPEQRAAMYQAHAALVEELETIAGAEATALDASIRPDTYDHYTEHLQDIREWRRRGGF